MTLPELVTLATERKAYRQFVHRVVQAPHPDGAFYSRRCVAVFVWLPILTER